MKKEFGIILSVAVLIATCQLVSHDWRYASADATVHAAPNRANASASGLSKPDRSTQRRILEDYGKLPLAFEKNQGQTDSRVNFLSRGAGYTLFLTANQAVLSLSASKVNGRGPEANRENEHRHTAVDNRSTGNEREQQPRNAILRMKLVGATPHATVNGVDELPGKSNYFVGNDPRKWRSNVPTYAKVKYEGIYPGIDLVYYGNQQKLEYDFIVAPGVDPRRIAFDIRGTRGIRRNENGDLVLRMEAGENEICWHKPVAYQEKNGMRQFIAAHYTITDANRVGFKVAEYDASKPLYIDPLVYSTYLGGTGTDIGSSIAVDSAGNAYVTGATSSTNFPTMNPVQAAFGGGTYDVFVTKLNASGSALVYSTYLGGTGDDSGEGIAVDGSGNAYVTGQTSSTNFPTVNPLQSANGEGAGGYTAFVAELNASGSALVYSTYLGGSGGQDNGYGIAVDSSGSAYVAGSTSATDFPTMNPLQPANDEFQSYTAFVTKLSTSGSLVYSTYLGGSRGRSAGTAGNDAGTGIAVDGSGSAYVVGDTSSVNFPTMNPLQAVNNGGIDAFVTVVNPTGSSLVYSTYLGGGNDDHGIGIAVDGSGNAYVLGDTSSSNFPTVNPFQSAYEGSGDAFVAKINPTGSALVYSTYLGGSAPSGIVVTSGAGGIAADSAGNAYVTGSTNSTNFPMMNPLQAVNNEKGAGSFTAFVTELNASGSALVYSTYLGGSGGTDEANGIAVDSSGNADVTGETSSTNFPTMNPLQPAYGGGPYDAFVAKFFAVTQSGPAASLLPSNLDFGPELAGTASGSQPIALGNTGSAALAISSIEISGTNSSDFTQTNNCGTGVAAGSSCTIAVTFDPTAAGTASASVVINDNASNSPQTVPLTGTATDFSLSAATGGNCPSGGNCSTSATVTAGKTAAYDLQASPVNGFSGTVTLSCADALAESTCSVSPSSVTMNGTASAFAVTVTTTAASLLGPQTNAPSVRPPVQIVLLSLVIVILALFLVSSSTESKRWKGLFVPSLALLLLGFVLLGGCGGGAGGNNGGGGGNNGTPSGTVTVTGNSSGVSHSASLTLNVN